MIPIAVSSQTYSCSCRDRTAQEWCECEHWYVHEYACEHEYQNSIWRVRTDQECECEYEYE